MPRYGINIGLPQQPPGMKDEDYGKFLPVYRAMHALAEQVSVATGNVTYSPQELFALSPFVNLIKDNSNIIYATAAVALTFGQLVNITVLDGQLTARIASKSGTPGKPAHGIAMSSAGVAVGGMATIRLLHGYCAGVSGTSVGSQYYLGDSGAMQISEPGISGEISQVVAIGLGSAGVFLNIPNMGMTI